jgi:hypothetical protein
MSQLQPTSEEEAARRATLRDLGGENRARITLASDGGINKWKPGDESSLLKRPGFRPGTDSHIISGTKAWGGTFLHWLDSIFSHYYVYDTNTCSQISTSSLKMPMTRQSRWRLPRAVLMLGKLIA